jgi:Uma2 family endonuclease
MNHVAPLQRRPATYADVLAAPPHMVAELVDGALHLQPRPAMRHARAGGVLTTEIEGPFQRGRGGPGGWWIAPEPEVHLADDVLVPDLAGWRRERLPVFPDAPFVDLAPSWVCEILSPPTRRLDLGRKRDLWAEHGAAHLWMVDPDARTLEAFALHEGRWLLLATLTGETAVSQPPFDAVAFPLADLWPPEPEAETASGA